MSKTIPLDRQTSPAPTRDTAATIPPRWTPWLRALWVLVVLDSFVIVGATLFFTRQLAETAPGRLGEGMRALGLSPDLYFWSYAGVIAVGFLCYFGIGVLVFVSRPKERIAWLASVFLIAFGASNFTPTAAEYFTVIETAPLWWRFAYVFNTVFSYGLFVAFFGLFPDGRFVPGWMRYVAAVVFIVANIWGAFPEAFGAPEGAMVFISVSIIVFLVGASIYAQVWRYRSYSTPLQKQQTKWMVLGLVFAQVIYLVPYLLTLVLFPSGQLSPASSLTYELLLTPLNVLQLFLPLAIAFAILRYRLWDIDILIRKTLTYAILVALLAAVYFVSIVVLQQMFASLTGARSEVITVISTLAIAVLFVPLRNRIQSVIDRRFYRKKYDAQQVLAEYARVVRDETDLDLLTGRLVEVVNETMKPESVSLWMRKTREH